MRVRTDSPPEGRPFILFLHREPAVTISTEPRFCKYNSAGGLERIPLVQASHYSWAGIAEAVVEQGQLCFVMAGTGKSEADGIEIEMDRGLRWAWAEIDDMTQETILWEGRES